MSALLADGAGESGRIFGQPCMEGDIPMLPWKRVVAAVDFSESSRAAAETAAAIAREARGQLVLLNVVELPPRNYQLVLEAGGIPDVREAWSVAARSELEKLAETLRAEGARVETRVRVGKPWKELLEEARERAAEAICLGDSGHSRFERLLLGSTAENVVRRSSIPVLVVRRSAMGPIRRALVPLDFDPGSAAALRFAVSRLPRDAEIHVLHVVPPIHTMEPLLIPIEPDRETAEADLAKILAKAVQGREVESEVAFLGDPAATILDRAEKLGVDLIVISTHGRRGLARALVGSVAEKVVRYSKGPVLVLPGPDHGTWQTEEDQAAIAAWPPDEVVVYGQVVHDD